MATGTGNLPYPMSPVSPFDVITSQAENERIANIESLADGTGVGDGAITAPKIDFATFNGVLIADYSDETTITGIPLTALSEATIYTATVDSLLAYSGFGVNGDVYVRLGVNAVTTNNRIHYASNASGRIGFNLVVPAGARVSMTRPSAGSQTAYWYPLKK